MILLLSGDVYVCSVEQDLPSMISFKLFNVFIITVSMSIALPATHVYLLSYALALSSLTFFQIISDSACQCPWFLRTITSSCGWHHSLLGQVATHCALHVLWLNDVVAIKTNRKSQKILVPPVNLNAFTIPAMRHELQNHRGPPVSFF